MTGKVDQLVADYRVNMHRRAISDARANEVARYHSFIQGRLIRALIDATSVNEAAELVGLSWPRLYQLMDREGTAPREDGPATPAEAVIQPLRSSKLDDAQRWGDLWAMLDADAIEALRAEHAKTWRRALGVAGIRDQYDPGILEGDISEWWNRLAPGVIEAALKVKVE